MTPPTLDIADLKAKGLAATAGPWEWCDELPDDPGHIRIAPAESVLFPGQMRPQNRIAIPDCIEDAAYIAAANPAAIGELIALAEAAAKYVEQQSREYYFVEDVLLEKLRDANLLPLREPAADAGGV